MPLYSLLGTSLRPLGRLPLHFTQNSDLKLIIWRSVMYTPAHGTHMVLIAAKVSKPKLVAASEW